MKMTCLQPTKVNYWAFNNSDVVGRAPACTEHAPGSYQERASDAHMLKLLRERFRCKQPFLRASFRAVDSDRSSTISLDEIAQALRSFHLHVTPATVKRLMRLVDSNRDGVVSYPEFAAAFELGQGSSAPLSKTMVSPKTVRYPALFGHCFERQSAVATASHHSLSSQRATVATSHF
jgi:EF-hand domain pair